MHVAIAGLLCMASFKVHRLIGFAFLAFLILILVGSVSLAWHYAVDGYAAILLTALIWWATQPLDQKQNTVART
jgi:di/tricarboxylate transporter